MRVEVKYFGPLKRALGKNEEWFDLECNAKISDLVNMLTEKYGNIFKKHISSSKLCTVYGIFIVFVNGQNIDFQDGLMTELKHGDVVALVPPLGGG
jgi:MoaD family protein